MVEPPQEVLLDFCFLFRSAMMTIEPHLLNLSLLPSVYLFPLLLEMLDLTLHRAFLDHERRRRLCGFLLCCFCLLICWGEIQGAAVSVNALLLDSPADSVDQRGEGFTVLTGHAFDVSLEDEEILRLDQHIELFELGVVFPVSDIPRVEGVGGVTGGRDARPVRQLEVGYAHVRLNRHSFPLPSS